jgi:hypothetical protein
MAQFWVIAVPFDVPAGGSHAAERDFTYQSLRTATEEQADYCVNFKVRAQPPSNPVGLSLRAGPTAHYTSPP